MLTVSLAKDPGRPTGLDKWRPLLLYCMCRLDRESKPQFVQAFADLMRALIEWPEVTGEVILRMLRLIEKAKYVTPSNLSDLLDLLCTAGLLEQAAFDEVPCSVAAGFPLPSAGVMGCLNG